MQNIIYRGRTFQFDFIIKVNGVPASITDDTVIIQINKTINSEIPAVEKEGNIDSETNGLVHFELTPEETSKLLAGIHLIQIVWHLNESDRVFTVFDDKFTVKSVIK